MRLCDLHCVKLFLWLGHDSCRVVQAACTLAMRGCQTQTRASALAAAAPIRHSGCKKRSCLNLRLSLRPLLLCANPFGAVRPDLCRSVALRGFRRCKAAVHIVGVQARACEAQGNSTEARWSVCFTSLCDHDAMHVVPSRTLCRKCTRARYSERTVMIRLAGLKTRFRNVSVHMASWLFQLIMFKCASA